MPSKSMYDGRSFSVFVLGECLFFFNIFRERGRQRVVVVACALTLKSYLVFRTALYILFIYIRIVSFVVCHFRLRFLLSFFLRGGRSLFLVFIFVLCGELGTWYVHWVDDDRSPTVQE